MVRDGEGGLQFDSGFNSTGAGKGIQVGSCQPLSSLGYCVFLRVPCDMLLQGPK